VTNDERTSPAAGGRANRGERLLSGLRGRSRRCGCSCEHPERDVDHPPPGLADGRCRRGRGCPRRGHRAARGPAGAPAVFAHGVASGDPLPQGVLVWTRVTPTPQATPGSGRGPQVRVGWEVAADERFRRVVRRGAARSAPGPPGTTPSRSRSVARPRRRRTGTASPARGRRPRSADPHRCRAHGEGAAAADGRRLVRHRTGRLARTVPRPRPGRHRGGRRPAAAGSSAPVGGWRDRRVPGVPDPAGASSSPVPPPAPGS
jgi:hypothetical protein